MVSLNCELIIFILSILGWSTLANLVQVKQGLLQGITMTSRNGTLFNAYFGIPYAAPPIGKLRFQPTVEAQPWNGTFNASVQGPVCLSYASDTKSTKGVEDCLNMNVFAPKNAKPGDNIPVIVYIYGGLFKAGQNADYHPQNLMDHPVIIAIPNYRVGVLGFMTTGDAVISGNMGLKDQVMAMKWVKENIYAFGGNPDQITLYGHSSGSMCVHLHTMSPMSVGLFQRVIISSGTGNGPASFFDRDVAKSIGRELAQRVGCNETTSKEIFECLSKADATLFPVIQEQMYLWDQDPDAAFRPTVELETAKSPFLTIAPPQSSHPATNYEWLIGTTTGECAFKAARYLSGDETLAKVLDVKYRKLFPIVMQYLWTSKLKYVDHITTSARKNYFGHAPIDDATAVPLMDMFTDAIYTEPTNEAIRHFPGVKYVYLYDYWANYTTQTAGGGNYSRRIGVSHAEDLWLIYWTESTGPLETERDVAFGKEMITRWINFVYSGNPNKPFAINERMYSAWEPVDPESPKIKYLRLKINGTMERNYGEKAHRFWKTLPLMSKFL